MIVMFEESKEISWKITKSEFSFLGGFQGNLKRSEIILYWVMSILILYLL